MSDPRLDFIEAIQAEPDDDVPRLIFADFLEDQGDPQAELIRVQLRLRDPNVQLSLDELGRMARRRSELLRHFDREWVEPLKRLGALGVEIRRGFVDELRISAADFVRNATEILALAPGLRLLNLRRAGTRISEVVETPEMHRIRYLDLRVAELSRVDLYRLSQAESLRQLTGLNLHGNHLGDEGLLTLGAVASFRLRDLNYGGNRVGDAGVTSIISSKTFENLRSLVLWSNSITPEGVLRLAGWEGLRNLRLLDLSYNGGGLIAGRLKKSEFWNPECQLIE